MNTFIRDYVSVADERDTETLLDQAAAWIADCIAVAPHSAPGWPPSRQYRSRGVYYWTEHNMVARVSEHFILPED